MFGKGKKFRDRSLGRKNACGVGRSVSSYWSQVVPAARFARGIQKLGLFLKS
jgi:hypothetical protein